MSTDTLPGEPCKHCNNGYLGDRLGVDVECVNGVLIDIDEAHEGWQRDVNYPVAPCHPMWEHQCLDPDGNWPNDCQKRLSDWASIPDDDIGAAIDEDMGGALGD